MHADTLTNDDKKFLTACVASIIYDRLASETGIADQQYFNTNHEKLEKEAVRRAKNSIQRILKVV